jgi:hypothetical protein
VGRVSGGGEWDWGTCNGGRYGGRRTQNEGNVRRCISCRNGVRVRTLDGRDGREW